MCRILRLALGIAPVLGLAAGCNSEPEPAPAPPPAAPGQVDPGPPTAGGDAKPIRPR